MLDLSRREADVALRAARPSEGDLFGRKLADIEWTVYEAAGLLDAHRPIGGVEGLREHSFIGWAETASPPTKAAAWLRAHISPQAIGYRSSSLINQMSAVKAGLGRAVLPCYLADPESGVARALPVIASLKTELWMVTHRSLKGAARVRAFMDIVGEGVRRRLAALSPAQE